MHLLPIARACSVPMVHEYKVQYFTFYHIWWAPEKVVIDSVVEAHFQSRGDLINVTLLLSNLSSINH